MKKMLALGMSLLLFLLALFGAQNLLAPKYMDESREGALTREYYADAHRNDVLIIGDCEVYENISPVTLWEEYGIPSFLRGNAQQLLWHSYAMLADALRYETPKVVVLSVLAMMYGEPQKETYNRMALDGLRWSRAKLDAVRASMLPEESFASYVLPLLRFHSRWSELSRNDWRYYFAKRQVGVAGFVMRSDVLPVPEGWAPTPKLLPSYDFGPKAWEYLDKITALCGEKGIQLVLFKAPSLTPHWYAEWDEQIVQYALEHGLDYLNALDKRDEIGIDFERDTYDAGLHLNRQGAEKMARYLGGFLLEHCPALSDRRGDAALDRDWAAKAARYHAMQAAQAREIAASGKVETLFVPETDPNQPISERTAPPPAIPMYFEPDGVRIELGADPAPALAKLGEPSAIFESPGYAHQEIDSFSYKYYEGFTFTALYPEQGAPYIVDIMLYDDNYSLPSGITNGSTFEEVVAAYGEGYHEEFLSGGDVFYNYTQGNHRLRFSIADGMVQQIFMLYDIFD